MTTTVMLDKAGRVVLPKPLRDELHLEPGDTLQLESEGASITLRPMRANTPLRKERGVWVFRRGTKLPAAVADKVIHDLREKRGRQNLGTER